MKVTVETITPQEAERLLQSNVDNRAIRKTRVALYAKQIKSNQWQATGEAIKVSKTGRLLDGQHRLHAVIVAGIPVDFLVIRDLEDEVFKVLDSGLARGANDVLRSLGLSNTSDAGAIIRQYLIVESGFSPSNTEASKLVTKTDISDYAEKNRPLITETVNIARNTRNAVGGSTTAWGTARLIANSATGTPKFDQFLSGVVSGASLGAGDPRLALRNWLAKNPKPLQTGITTPVHLGTIIKAFTAWVNGEKIHLLRSWDTSKPLSLTPSTKGNISRQVYP